MKFKYFVPSIYRDFVRKCRQILHSDEVGIFLFFPKTDRIRRADQFIQDYRGKDKIIQVDFVTDEVDNVDDIIFILKKKLGRALERDNVGIFVTNADLPIRQKNYQVIDEFVKIQEENPNLHFILLMEIDITNPEIAHYFTRTSVFTNINYYPLYETKDSLDFINYLAKKWNINIRKNVKKTIVNNCGGHFWLLKYVVRSLRDNPKLALRNIFNSTQMQFRLEQINNLLLDSEKSALKKVIEGEAIKAENEKHGYAYLKELNLLENDKLNIPILTEYMRKSLPDLNLVVTDRHVFLNNVIVDAQFSKMEKRVFKSLYNSRNQIVSRDQVAKAIWPRETEEKYSDWAMDRLIARLRKKLIGLGISKERIKTFRKKGYMLTSQLL